LQVVLWNKGLQVCWGDHQSCDGRWHCSCALPIWPIALLNHVLSRHSAHTAVRL